MSEIGSPQKREVSDSSALFVSLYIVLLAFFIMLNSMSKFDAEKTEDAIKSVSKALGINIPLEDLPDFFQDVGADISPEQFFSELKSTVASIVPIEELKILEDGSELEMSFPETYLFPPKSAIFRETDNELMTKIAKTLDHWLSDMRIEFEGIIPENAAPPMADYAAIGKIPHNKKRLDVLRAANIADFLIDRKLNKKSVITGIKIPANDRITFHFVVREIYKAKFDPANISDIPQKPDSIQKPNTPQEQGGM